MTSSFTDSTLGSERTARQIIARDLPRVESQGSPIGGQARDNRGQPPYIPCRLTFLTGDLKGKDVDLGVLVESVSHSQQSHWEDHDNQTLRISGNFKRISHRDINLKVVFYVLNEDVGHLGENLAHLHEIYPADYHPPLLLFKQGSLEANQCVCTALNWTYDTPLPEEKGYRRCEADIALKLLGGIDSPHALAPPLTGTPLLNEQNQENPLLNERDASADVVEKLLAKCLGEEGAQKAGELIRDHKLSDVEELERLDPNLFIQLILGGIINTSILKDERLQEKIKRDLAIAIAISQPGLSRIQQQRIANAILNGTNGRLSSEEAVIYSSLSNIFPVILEAILNNNLGVDSPVFKEENAAAGQQVRKAGACGFSIRKAGGEKIGNGGQAATQDSATDRAKLAKINEFIASEDTTDEQVRKRFGLESSVQVRVLRNAAPYSSKADFWERASTSAMGATGIVIWENFH